VSADIDPEQLVKFAAVVAQMKKQLGKVLIGQTDVLDQLIAAIATRGHVLLVGVPGLAKTLMVSSLSQILDVGFKRVQFTPDLMPSDITGTTVLDENDQGKREFRFVRGPIFTNILLADEINRTPPKTQAALLEAMQERQVSAGQESHKLPDPFFVIATQNPIEQEGTYPLPEAQLDRFMFSVKVGYPTLAEEQQIIDLTSKDEVAELTKVLPAKGILSMQKLVRQVALSRHIRDYVVNLVRATRPEDPTAPDFIKSMVDFGAGVRAGQYLVRAGQAYAAMDGKTSIDEKHIRRAALPVLRHRIGANFQAQAAGKSTDDLITELLKVVRGNEPEKYVKK